MPPYKSINLPKQSVKLNILVKPKTPSYSLNVKIYIAYISKLIQCNDVSEITNYGYHLGNSKDLCVMSKEEFCKKYFTYQIYIKNSDGSKTRCEIVDGNYVRSVKNDTIKDNLLSLPYLIVR
jgi:hypothetical protein